MYSSRTNSTYLSRPLSKPNRVKARQLFAQPEAVKGRETPKQMISIIHISFIL